MTHMTNQMTNQIAIFQPHAGLTISIDLPQHDSLVSFRQSGRSESGYAQWQGSLGMRADNTGNRDSVQGGSP
jgi:hypothetical protein